MGMLIAGNWGTPKDLEVFFIVDALLTTLRPTPTSTTLVPHLFFCQ